MSLPKLLMLIAMLMAACATVLAQGGDLSGVTMRVVDDISGIDAVVIELAPAGDGQRPAVEPASRTVEPAAVTPER